MPFFIMGEQVVRKLREAGYQRKQGGKNMNKKSDAPGKDVYVILFDL